MIQIAKQILQSRVRFIRASFIWCSRVISRPRALVFVGYPSVGGCANSVAAKTLQREQKGPWPLHSLSSSCDS